MYWVILKLQSMVRKLEQFLFLMVPRFSTGYFIYTPKTATTYKNLERLLPHQDIKLKPEQQIALVHYINVFGIVLFPRISYLYKQK